MQSRKSLLWSRDAENYICSQLEAQGWNILARNFRIVGAELDLVATKGKTLAIIEVKARKHKPATLADWETLLPPRKRAALKRGGMAFLSRVDFQVSTVRFDLALVWGEHRPYGVEYIVNAFA